MVVSVTESEGDVVSAKPTRPPDESRLRQAERGARQTFSRGQRAFNKFNNDWTMNLVSLVAYNALTSIFPLLLALFTILAFVPAQSGHAADFATAIDKILPADVASKLNISSLLARARRSFGILSVISIGGLLWGGSNLFGAIENAFAIVYRVRTRDFVQQKLMALAMIMLFAILLPLSFVSTVVLGAGTTALGNALPGARGGPLPIILGFGTGLAALFILFLSIFVVVPNFPLSWHRAWRGAVVAAVSMSIVNTAFPFYIAHFVGTSQYGAAAISTVIIMISWFWLFSLILLVGAQVNALSMGLEPLPHDVARILADRKADPA